MLIKPVFLDIETMWGHVVELALVNHDGQTIFHSIVCPSQIIGSYQLQQKGIEYSEIINSPSWTEVLNEVSPLLRNRHVVIHNSDYDLQFIPLEISNTFTSHCSMKRFGPYAGHYRYKYGTYPYISLEQIASTFNWKYEDPGPHRAIPDCLMARQLWQWMEANHLPNSRSLGIPTRNNSQYLFK